MTKVRVGEKTGSRPITLARKRNAVEDHAERTQNERPVSGGDEEQPVLRSEYGLFRRNVVGAALAVAAKKNGHERSSEHLNQMKLLFFMPLVVSCFIGCSRKEVSDSRASWLLESYVDGVITVQHEGNTYKARCDISRSLNNKPSITDEGSIVESPTCDLPVGLVGHNIQPVGGINREADGWIVVMGNVGSMLALRRWKDERTPWRQDEFKITSVVKMR